MASPSKEEQILKLILENSPLKHWHCKEFVKKTDMTRALVNKWLKKYEKEGLIKHVKKKGKFPYFTAGKDNPIYKSKKKEFLLNKIYQSGLISHLIRLEKIKTAIIFGSAAKGDWYKNSDIDLFVYGDIKTLEKHKYEKRLNKEIELHIFNNKKDIKNIKTGLIKNVVNGYLIKGSIHDFVKVSQ